MFHKIKEADVGHVLFTIASALMLFLFLPVLFCVIFIGNNMDYYEVLKLQTVAPNVILFAVGVICFLIYCVFARWTQNFELTPKRNRITNGLLVLAFTAVYFLNILIMKEISFRLPWDVMVVSGHAVEFANDRPLGNAYYFSIYTNNIPITYFLGKLLKFAYGLKNYPYPHEFFWVQVNTFLVSVGGYFSCLTVKKLTKKVAPTLLTFALYFVLVSLTAWKMAPYTDTYSLAFPVMCIYFYLSYRQTDVVWKRILYCVLSIFFGMVGGLIKPSCYVAIVAVLLIEVIKLIREFKNRIGYWLLMLFLAIGLMVASDKYMDHMIDAIGLDYNESLEVSWHLYFYMGLNEDTTGSDNGADTGLAAQYPNDREALHKAQIAAGVERLKERGFWGTIYFWLRKLTMTFNDGMFGWSNEVWAFSYYDGLYSNSAWNTFLREIYWSGPYVGANNTISQMVWIFSMVCITGICFRKKKTLDDYVILITCFLGMFLYQLFFEARARYLIPFLPVLLVAAACGAENYFLMLSGKVEEIINIKERRGSKHEI